MRKPIIFLGESLQIRDLRETCDLVGLKVAGIIDDDFFGNTAAFDGIPFIGSEKNVDWQALKKEYDFFISVFPVPAVPRNKLKRKNFIRIVDEMQLPCANIIDPQCRISPSAILGQGIFVGYNAYVSPNTRIGDHCQLHLFASVMHDCVLGRNTILNRATAMISSITVGENVYVAPFARVLNEHGHIGDDSQINAGVMVFRNTEPGEVVNITGRKIYSTVMDSPKTLDL